MPGSFMIKASINDETMPQLWRLSDSILHKCMVKRARNGRPHGSIFALSSPPTG
jgi:hypothetical protein